jgi:serine/threonine protein kinase
MKSEKDPQSLAALTPPGEHQSPLGDPFDLGAFNPPSIEELDQQIPAYEFLEFIDRGGMGAVYRARQRSLNRIVAVKLLPVSLRNRRVFAERFNREARALALLNHPNIVSVYDSGEASGGCLYYAMEYVKGTNLRRFMKEGRATAKQLLNIAMQVCEALQFAHSRGVVHRDVKPANILIDENGRAKVADFGLAKVIGAPPQHLLTGASDALGTPDYMAPEAVTRDYEVDHRADIYSLGVMLYEMLTSHVPKGAWEPPSRAVGVDERFDEVVSRALQVDPKRRYQSVGDLSTVVRQLIEPTTGAGGSPSPALERTPQPSDPGQAAGPSATTVHLGKKPGRSWWRNTTWGLSTLSLLALGYFLFGDYNGTWEKIRTWTGASKADEAKNEEAEPSGTPTPASGPQARREIQMALARWVFEHRGFVNIQTPADQSEQAGGGADIYDESGLPKGEFTVYRVTMANTPFGDEDLVGLVNQAVEAGPVRNLNLYNTQITGKGLAALPRLSSTLRNLNIGKTATLTSEGVQYLGQCRNLSLLKITNPASDPMNLDVGEALRLLDQLKDALPNCNIQDS